MVFRPEQPGSRQRAGLSEADEECAATAVMEKGVWGPRRLAPVANGGGSTSARLHARKAGFNLGKFRQQALCRTRLQRKCSGLGGRQVFARHLGGRSMDARWRGWGRGHGRGRGRRPGGAGGTTHDGRGLGGRSGGGKVLRRTEDSSSAEFHVRVESGGLFNKAGLTRPGR